MKTNKDNINISFILLLLVIIFKLVFFLWTNRQFFLREFDPEYFGRLYSESQYIKGELSEGGIGDDGLYAFAGYYYLFQAGDVSSVNFEHPPLGKYLIGLSILLFRNENVINIIYLIFLLVVTKNLAEMILKDKTISLVPILILAFDPLLLDNLKRSLLDLPFTLFFTTAVYFFLKANQDSRYFYISFLFWAAAFSVRFFPFFALIYFLLLIYVFCLYPEKLVSFFWASLIVPAVYIISHAFFFFYHPSFIEFIRHKKWMVSWFLGSPKIAGNIFRNIFTGSYISPQAEIVKNNHFNLTIPAVFVLSLLSFFAGMDFKTDFANKAKHLFDKKKELIFIYALSIIYILYIAILTTGVQKFIMHIYPLLSVLAVYSAWRIYSIIKLWIRRILPL